MIFDMFEIFDTICMCLQMVTAKGFQFIVIVVMILKIGRFINNLSIRRALN
jgi:hypothetical protein